MEISELQKDLAAAFRWTARLNMHEGIANHFSVCMPDSNDFYVNGSGMHFSTIKASDLVLVEQNKIIHQMPAQQFVQLLIFHDLLITLYDDFQYMMPFY